MFVELRRNLQTIIPKRIAADLGLEIGDLVEVVEEDGVILVIPVKKSASSISHRYAQRAWSISKISS